jgi:hypothetical protein
MNVDQPRNKMMGSENAGNAPLHEFFFPTDGDRPAVTIQAHSMSEARRLYEQTAAPETSPTDESQT